MYHYYPHLNPAEYLLVKLIASIFTWEAITAITAIVVGIVAWGISKKQLDLINYSEVFLQTKKIGNDYNWEFQLRNGSNHVIYITEIIPKTQAYMKYNIKISSKGSGRLSLPAKDNMYYTLPVPPASELGEYNPNGNNCEIYLVIHFEDNLDKYESHHVAWFQPPNDNINGIWSIQNLGSKKLKH